MKGPRENQTSSKEETGLDWNIQEELSDWINMIRLGKTETVQAQDECPSSFHVLLNGLLGVYRTAGEDKKLLVHKLHPGDTIGVTQMFRESPSPFSVVPIKESIALRGTREDLERFREEWPEALTKTILTENKVVHSSYQEVQNFYGEPVETRIARTLLGLADDIGRPVRNGDSVKLVAKLNRKEISEMIGCTHESVSRIMAEWERDETISTEHKYITILKPHRLRSIISDDT